MIEDIIALAVKAGEKILETYEREATIIIKDDKSPVTEADLASHAIIIEGLASTGIPILSEEGELISETKRLWLVDPLDGTKDFIGKSGEFAVMIALVEDGKPTLAVVHAPALGKTYFAEKGKGSFVRDTGGERQLQVSNHETEGARFLASQYHFSTAMEEIAHRIKSVVLRHGSIGLKAGGVAAGEGEYVIHLADLHPWDTAVSELLITEAGGRVTDIQGNSIEYFSNSKSKGFVGSNGVVHDDVIHAIQEISQTSLS
ncbi:MAG: 3'(2'),5'-bisphosphate nucleotidase CysQ [Minisyncoccia bacterium]